MMANDTDATYTDLVIGHESVISARYDWLYSQMNYYIEANDLLDKVRISEDILNHVVIDYFVDIKRLKDFHDQIEYTNKAKIYAYTSFWILRHKPLQLLSDDLETEVFINEHFVSELLRCFLFDDPDGVVILKKKEEDITEFLNTLLYYFKYRDFSAQGIEMIILAFNAGKGYQYSYDHRS